MTAALLQRYPVDVLHRPERQVPPPGALEMPWHRIRAVCRLPGGWQRWRLRRALPAIHRLGERLSALGDVALDAYIESLRDRLLAEGLSPRLSREAFATVREVAWRELGMAHHDVQLMGGLALLEGKVAEMPTGEGKTLTATLPAATAALAGVPVHVVTVNDYLAGRDAQAMTPIYARLGLTVGVVTHERSPRQRRAAYAADITYCTNKELVFDYLRDGRELGSECTPLQAHAASLRGALDQHRLLLRGLHFAIVDEADSVMLDEARTPLILSGPDEGEPLDIALIDEVLTLSERYREGEDFVRESGRLHLTEAGKVRLVEQAERRLAAQGERSGWLGKARREWLLQQALVARHQFQRDRHYLVRDGQVQIIDEHTGRVLADRRWERGLQQMVERLEGCRPSEPNRTLARLTYQRFFRRYQHLSGMTGTACEVRGELWWTYRLRVVSIPPHRPSRRRHLGVHAFDDDDGRWQWVAERAAQLAARRRPVLIATASLADSEVLSRRLEARGLEHAVLNARQDAEEAATVARAGCAGAITVATSMAGRGTDIALDEEAREAGGLHVIIAGRHDASRIDRQIAGRCARQGDPGSVEYALSDTDPLLDELAGWQRHIGPLPVRLSRAQRQRERRHARERARLLDADWRENELLGFSGKTE
ncbi:preprotein translocase subunit SecA [Billgrantia gudaonensis]|uniref:Protein translocase subunit SecA n=1 Tax=Billgrantia gudaonensis TaxID=376427 RepID=A0A1G8T4B8_9GAMM|nr:preprotein translocase subunit SecA [Halomonas gudaonensis]SDJ36392.1 protein translocase subunit secA [Halomonas gudaonensis]